MKSVCLKCFHDLGRQRERRIRRTQDHSRIAACGRCGYGCFDLQTARCLFCGVSAAEWSLKESVRRGLRRCRICQELFTKRKQGDVTCDVCQQTDLRCHWCGLSLAEERPTRVAHRLFCRSCAKRVARCALCHEYSVALLRKAEVLAGNEYCREDPLDHLIRPRGTALWRWEFAKHLNLYCEKCHATLARASDIFDSARVALNRIRRRTHVSWRTDVRATRELARTIGPSLPWDKITAAMLLR
jgi:hypothetical protein